MAAILNNPAAVSCGATREFRHKEHGSCAEPQAAQPETTDLDLATSSYLFDLAELHFGVGVGPVTGINRVGLAYLDVLIASGRPLYGLVNYHRSIALPDRRGVVAYAKGLHGIMLRAEYHLGRVGRVPSGLVAHLGAKRPDGDFSSLPPEINFDRPSFVILGTIGARKNHALLLDLWERFAAETAAGDDRPMPQLLILGRRGWRNEAIFRGLDSGPLRGVHIHEIADLPDSAVAATLCRSAALLLPSFTEGFGLPALEAALLGCPIIANDLPVCREFLRDLPTYVKVTDPEPWAQAVRKAVGWLRDPGQILRGALPTWDSHFATVLGILRQPSNALLTRG
ncbi:MAG TPA: hypothetical protein DHV56_14990 [Rhodobacter sp.]|nr:hypothetical protein [Rhodobacter sp.]